MWGIRVRQLGQGMTEYFACQESRIKHSSAQC